MREGLEIKVLDHGYVKLIDSMGTDESIVESARMSTGKGFEGWEPGAVCDECSHYVAASSKEPMDKCGNCDSPLREVKGDAKLLDFMYKNKHATPFEFCVLTIEVQAPIMVFREWHRHRTMSYSEMSARYTQMPDLHYLPAPERIQRQSKTNKQGSAEPVSPVEARGIVAGLQAEQEMVYDHYDNLVKRGIAKEVARLNTPVSRYSRMRATTDLRNWLAFLLLRMAPNAQWEIRQYANAVAEIVKAIWPRTYALFEEYDLHGVRLSRTEVKLMLDMARGEGTSDAGKALFQRLEGGSS